MINFIFPLQVLYFYGNLFTVSGIFKLNINFILSKPLKLFDRIKPDWVPSLKLAQEKCNYGDNDDMQSRYLRTKRRADKRLRIEQNEEKPHLKNRKRATEVINKKHQVVQN